VIARVLAERLQGCEASTELQAVLRSPGVDWERVVGLASAHRVLPAFSAALRNLDLIGLLDEELGAFLQAVHAANLERNAELRDELILVAKILNRVEIEPVLLKGAIRLLDGLYPDDGWRTLRDLDLLVPEAMLAEAIRAFGEAGYEPCALHNEVRRKEGACQIDLHREALSGSTQLRLLKAEDILIRSTSFVLEDGKVRIPSIEDQIVHLIGHGQIRHRGHAMGKIGLADRLEVAALVHWGCQRIDWPAISSRFAAAGYHRPLLAFLLALNEGAWCSVPMTPRTDRLTALQQYRVRVQARSATFEYIGSRAGWWASECRSQVRERDAGQLRAIKNIKKLVAERGAIRRMVRSFLHRKSPLLQFLTPLSCSSLHEYYLSLMSSL
jgi:Uncharacterised nucleotidyltransferase